MARQRITDPLVRSLAPPTSRQQVITYDDALPGFGVRVTRGGAKSFVLNYVVAGRERRFTIGSSAHWKAAAARDEAKRLKRLVDTGVDPLAERETDREALTVGELLDVYLDSNRFKAKATSTQAGDRGRIERHIRPLLGSRKAFAVTAADVERAFNAIAEGRTAVDEKTGNKRGRARVTGGEGTARKAIRLLSAVFTWAIATKRASANPCQHVDTGKDGRRRLALDDKQYHRLWTTLAALEEVGMVRPAAADCIRLVALTGCRRGEAVGLRWRDVHLDRRTLVLVEHKTASSTGLPRVIGLSDTAHRIVARQPRGKPDHFVFASSAGPRTAITLSKEWTRVRDAARLPAKATLHTLRHSLASAFADHGASAPAIAALLGHSDFTTSQGYVHTADAAHARIADEAARLVLKNK